MYAAHQQQYYTSENSDTCFLALDLGNANKVNGVFEMRVKNGKGVEQSWIIEMKKVRGVHTEMCMCV